MNSFQMPPQEKSPLPTIIGALIIAIISTTCMLAVFIATTQPDTTADAYVEKPLQPENVSDIAVPDAVVSSLVPDELCNADESEQIDDEELEPCETLEESELEPTTWIQYQDDGQWESQTESDIVQIPVEPQDDDYSADYLRSMGVVYDDNYRYTWYSQNVLPGGGLDIPGRTVDADGYVTDGDGNICLASSDLPYGTVVETPFGTGVVYDTGCASGTLDVYTAW